MATDVILPALGMSQDTGKIVQWLKTGGEQVAKGEPLAEIETDKATVEIQAPADGVLAHVSAAAGDDVPVGQVIATILTPEEVSPEVVTTTPPPPVETTQQSAVAASPLASRIAAEHNLNLNQVKAAGGRIQKADVLTYLQDQDKAVSTQTTARVATGQPMASPKARRLAAEQGKDLTAIKGSGPEGAVL
ncbi:MAG: biotin/lipoyl-containing protein, partial [Ktedonobacteraceae bacterium]